MIGLLWAWLMAHLPYREEFWRRYEQLTLLGRTRTPLRRAGDGWGRCRVKRCGKLLWQGGSLCRACRKQGRRK